MKTIKSLLFLIAMTLISSQSFSMQKLTNLFKKPVKASMSKGLKEARLKREIYKIANKFKWPNNRIPKFYIGFDKDKNNAHAGKKIFRGFIISLGDDVIDSSKNELEFTIAHELAHCQQNYCFEANMYNLLHAQSIELDADKRAIIALQDASGAIEFFEKLAIKEENDLKDLSPLSRKIENYLQFYASHPRSKERLEKAKEIQNELNRDKKD